MTELTIMSKLGSGCSAGKCRLPIEHLRFVIIHIFTPHLRFITSKYQ
jgi:hypothetical protein